LYDDCVKRKSAPQVEKVIQIFVASAIYFSSVYVLLDAFDECPPLQQREVVELVRKLNVSPIKILLTSRPQVQILKQLLPSAVQEKDIKSDKVDVAKYISNRFEQECFVAPGPFRDTLLKEVKKYCHETYHHHKFV